METVSTSDLENVGQRVAASAAPTPQENAAGEAGTDVVDAGTAAESPQEDADVEALSAVMQEAIKEKSEATA
jgi:hypothetical protein